MGKFIKKPKKYNKPRLTAYGGLKQVTQNTEREPGYDNNAYMYES